VAHTEFSEKHIKDLEMYIDMVDNRLPKLTNFILPGGGFAAAHFHVARTVCRRAERDLVTLLNDDLIDSAPYMYVNRLSDYLF
jgi:cob(I)alamin adenosyltransferase